MYDVIRDLLHDHGRLPIPVEEVAEDQDLFKTGLTSFACVQLLLAIEDRFDIEFPAYDLKRKTFETIETIVASVRQSLLQTNRV